MLTTDRFFHGHDKQTAFFEGWYHKHQIGEEAYAFIPGLSIQEDGTKEVFIQVINHEGAHYFSFPETDFQVSEEERKVTIGDNIFSEAGIQVSLKNNDLQVQGAVKYNDHKPIQRTRYAPSIMGPFSYLSFMECYHGVLSMSHTLEGTLYWNEEPIDFTNGIGYLEKDWGTSFPAAYIWVQCNSFDAPDVRFFFSAADIPFAGFAFLGTICVLQVGSQEYRFATYHGAKIHDVKRTEDRLVIHLKQKQWLLTIEVLTKEGHSLLAPSIGQMNRIIRESASTEITLTLLENGQEILRQTGKSAGFEEVGNLRGFHY